MGAIRWVLAPAILPNGRLVARAVRCPCNPAVEVGSRGATLCGLKCFLKLHYLMGDMQSSGHSISRLSEAALMLTFTFYFVPEKISYQVQLAEVPRTWDALYLQ